MLSKEFLEYQHNVPTAPPTGGMPGGPGGPGGPEGPGGPGGPGGPEGPGGPMGGGQIPEEYANLGVPMMPPDYVPPDPVIPEGYTGGKVKINGVTGLHLTRAGVREKAALLYIHGGGFTIGTAMTASDILAHFLEETGLEGYAVEYSLAPYAKFPVAVNEIVDFYKGLQDLGYEKIVVGGESAGAGLTLSMAHAVRMAGLSQPTALWCSSPVDNIRYDLEELLVPPDMFVASTPGMMDAYVGDADIKDPRLSPIYGDFTDFPPTFIQAGSTESLSAGALRLVNAITRAGSELIFHFGKGMPHTFAMDYGKYPEATNAMKEITDFVNNQLALA